MWVPPAHTCTGRVGVSDPFSDRPPLPHSSPSLLGRKKPPSLFLRNQGTQSLAPKTTPNFRPSSSIATARRASMTSPMQPKLTPKSNSPSLRSKLKGQVPFSYPKMERDLTRRRAETVPASAYRGVAKPKKKISLPRPPPGIGRHTLPVIFTSLHNTWMLIKLTECVHYTVYSTYNSVYKFTKHDLLSCFRCQECARNGIPRTSLPCFQGARGKYVTCLVINLMCPHVSCRSQWWHC